MKFKTILPILTLLVALVGCNKPAGELVGAGKAKNFSEADPFGMLLIRKGSFMKGENTQSNLFTMPDNKIMSTVDAFWMDETEITNNEYKQFVFWVRDSIAMTLLVRAGAADEYADGLQFMVTPKEEFIEEIIPDTALNWAMTSKIPWNKYKTDEEVHAALRPLFYSDHTFNTNRMHYHYSWKNYDQAKLQQNKFDVAKGKYPDNARARVDSFWVDENGVIFDTTIIRKLVEPKDLYTECIINIYPDTMVWIRDFQYAYNDPKMLKYFSHEGYANYPVVGVTWEQAHAFCHWRTKIMQDNTTLEAQVYRLPTESEWEYAARGGRKMATYPWGSNYVRDYKGCFLANFKPYHGAYNDDTGNGPMAVASYRPNDFGLFDMSGNVSEWTMESYTPTASAIIHDYNPNHAYMARKNDPDQLKRKVIKGGSWKDVKDYLQCGARDYEYQYESRPYIGFRCVRSYIGE